MSEMIKNWQYQHMSSFSKKNIFNFRLIGLFLFFCSCSHAKQNVQVLANAHAHNDYEHERPLLDALDNGFISVEVDVYSIDNQLWVSHEKPDTLDLKRTLEALYLLPLSERIKEKKGYVYDDYDDFFYLMIDIKTPAEKSYSVLREILSKYEDIISVVTDSGDQNKPVKIFITGFHGRPFNQILADSIKYGGIDGRPNELGMGISKAHMPVISQNYNKYLSWNGIDGQPDSKELDKLVQLINQTHAEDKKLRLWAAPDNEKVWSLLRRLGVDLLNTDKLQELRYFLLAQPRN